MRGLVLLLCLGCAQPTWTMEGAGQARLDLDAADCQTQAADAGRRASFDGRHVIADVAHAAAERCMEAKGWRQQTPAMTAPWPAPPPDFAPVDQPQPATRRFQGPDGALLTMTFQPGPRRLAAYPVPPPLRVYDRGAAAGAVWAVFMGRESPAGEPVLGFGASAPRADGRLVAVAVQPLGQIPQDPSADGRQHLEAFRARWLAWLASVAQDR